ncbi:hypothetical protein A2U01_0040539, partial [Trifolium medium]|nr:hypothetical protein [Trifolium medium]
FGFGVAVWVCGDLVCGVVVLMIGCGLVVLIPDCDPSPVFVLADCL